jgi:hypothetical protein
MVRDGVEDDTGVVTAAVRIAVVLAGVVVVVPVVAAPTGTPVTEQDYLHIHI